MFLSRSEGYYPIPWVTQPRYERDSLRQRGHHLFCPAQTHLNCRGHVSSGLGAGFNSETGSRIRANTLSAATPQVSPRSQWPKQRVETLGRGPHHRDLAGSCFVKKDDYGKGSKWLGGTG